MEDLSLHILDIVENATNGGATLIKIEITKDTGKDLFRIVIQDNGCGMDREMILKVRDPFVTTRTTRRFGLGLPLLEQTTKESGGNLFITSEPGIGTEVKATFQASHIDLKPLGDFGLTIASLISGNPDVDFLFESNFDGEKMTLDTREIKAELEGCIKINDPKVLILIKNLFSQNADNN